ncbi:MAG: deoxyribodipyrimidine photolyase-related protein [Saprospiraceae bacterium]|jgi:deoxyribodipyrimidine photolyase-related protein
MKNSYTKLRLILGDQLNENHSWFDEKRDDTLYFMAECLTETSYAKHHIQKVVGFFSAMRNFAKSMEAKGHSILYFNLDTAENLQSFPDNLAALIKKYSIQKFEYQLPDEWRLDVELKAFAQDCGVENQVFDSQHFLTERAYLKDFFEGKKTYLMETFYRSIRKRYEILMEPDGKNPLTGKWNYDASNRKKLPKKITIPPQLHWHKDVTEIVEMLKEKQVTTIGNIEVDDFIWPTSRAECLELLEEFCRYRLNLFGDYQDALTTRDYALFHCRLSFGMNTKMISPLEVVQRCIEEFHKRQDTIDISQIEGFVRQIIGWREYMRGVYWAKMPGYEKMNYFNHQAALPDWFWTGKTKMTCLNHAVEQSLDRAYAHHIQRLMVTGNFALLLGVHPDELDEWYLGIYIDALHWVEVTNTRGMSQFADGGIVGTKPYISSANYIHKQGDYCNQCHYDRKLKYGEKACPFNSLYWDFFERHREKLGNNFRMSMMYRIWDKMDMEEKEKILRQADAYKKTVNKL